MKSSRFSLLSVLAAAVAVFPAMAASQTVEAGIEAWQRADYAAAIEIWRPLAERGNPDAAFNLGQAYRFGRGVAADLATAETWLERAARADHVEAQTTLGLMLFDRGNRQAAIRWLRQAATRGEPRAMLVYGAALFNGDGVLRDQLLAYAYVSRAAERGLAQAKSALQELDRLMPVEQRERALAMALPQPADEPAPEAKAAAAVPKPEPARVPAPPAADIAKAASDTPPVEAQAEVPTAAPPPADIPKAAPDPPAVQAQAEAPAAEPPPAGGRWRIQLGAFSRRSSAEALYRSLSEAEPVAGRQPFYVAAGAVTRLQVGPFPSRAAANAACAALASKGQDCFPVDAGN